MKIVKLIAPALVLSFGLVLSTGVSQAKKEYTAKEKKPCAFCHVTATSKELNEAGKYYKDKKTLEGFKAEKK